MHMSAPRDACPVGIARWAQILVFLQQWLNRRGVFGSANFAIKFYMGVDVGQTLKKWRKEVDENVLPALEKLKIWPWKIVSFGDHLRVAARPRLRADVVQNSEDLWRSLRRYKLTIGVPSFAPMVREGIALFHRSVCCVDVNAVILKNYHKFESDFQMMYKTVRRLDLSYASGCCFAFIDMESDFFDRTWGNWPSPQLVLCDALCAVQNAELPGAEIFYEYETTRFKILHAQRHDHGNDFVRRGVLKKTN